MLLFILSFCIGLVLGWYIAYPLLDKGYRLRVPWERVYSLKDLQPHNEDA